METLLDEVIVDPLDCVFIHLQDAIKQDEGMMGLFTCLTINTFRPILTFITMNPNPSSEYMKRTV